MHRIFTNSNIDGRQEFTKLSDEENDIARRDRILAEAGIQARRNESPSREKSHDEVIKGMAKIVIGSNELPEVIEIGR